MDGQGQTDEWFTEQIVRHKGQEFYRTVLVPASAPAIQAGRICPSIGETMRRDWTPTPAW